MKNQRISNWNMKSKKTGYGCKEMTWITSTPASYDNEAGELTLINLISYGRTKKESEQDMLRQCFNFGKGELSVLTEER